MVGLALGLFENKNTYHCETSMGRPIVISGHSDQGISDDLWHSDTVFQESHFYDKSL